MNIFGYPIELRKAGHGRSGMYNSPSTALPAAVNGLVLSHSLRQRRRTYTVQNRMSQLES